MASTGVNVLRWSALVLGVFYGFSHQSSLTARDKASHAHHEYERKQSLIDEARLKFKEKSSPSKGNGVITDPDNPKFDMEAYLLDVEKRNPDGKR